MNNKRRTLLKASSGFTVMGLAFAAGLIRPIDVFAAPAGYPEKAFHAKSLDELMKSLGGKMPTESKDISLIVPDIAENGAMVAVGAESRLANTTEIALLVAHNPAMMSAQFMIPAGTDAKINTRLKMGKTSDVYALVKADGKYYFARQEVKVTLGGCGA